MRNFIMYFKLPFAYILLNVYFKTNMCMHISYMFKSYTHKYLNVIIQLIILKDVFLLSVNILSMYPYYGIN